MIIGVTGRIATGKSALSKSFERLGFIRLDADSIYHGLLKDNRQMIGELTEEYGSSDTKTIYKKVKDDSAGLARLNDITHKYVIAEIDAELAAGRGRDFVLDVPVPVDRGFIDVCGYIFTTDCSEGTQVGRLIERNGYSRQEAMDRINIQQKRKFYTELADFVVNTEGMTALELDSIAEGFCNRLKKRR